MEERSGMGRDEGEKGGDEGDISAAASVRSRCQKGGSLAVAHSSLAWCAAPSLLCDKQPSEWLLLRLEGAIGEQCLLAVTSSSAAVLVHYYPFAGRLRELEGHKLAVDCTGEGVLFVEADANVRIDQFDVALGPPFPCLDELLFDVPGSSGILDCPLLLFQVTRLACGGFAMAVRIQHTMADGAGMLQLLGAIAELARGAPAPTGSSRGTRVKEEKTDDDDGGDDFSPLLFFWH
ncbi:Omega-hydroxypalmitate O-feruloyl transferase [Triticum urartu]|uniref:Omega-hydroxypalmitate O-feruloyl transferase n=1 Tax=Triticum urartu TaxID=4572 RepID=M7Z1Y0_TRIUA|nr:Omega-hydroxypalmitate O-feruloyl transferase [Triticum urartu]